MALKIPYLCEGEILSVNDGPSSDGGGMAALSSMAGGGELEMRPVVSYVCRITLPDSTEFVCPNVLDSNPFGGIADYMQIRRRATEDASVFKMGKGGDMNAHVGDRVLVAFIGGDISNAVIVSGLQHPLQIPRFDEGTGPDLKPQMKMRYLGLGLVVDEKGQFTVTHYGAPKIKYTGTQGLADMKGAAGDAIAGLSSTSTSGYEGFDEGDEPTDEPESDAVVPRDTKVKTLYEFLDNGTYRIRDSIGQNFTIDPEKSQIEITNSGLSSTSSADGGMMGSVSGALGGSGEDAEVIRLDKVEQSIFINARQLITIISAGDRIDTTTGDYTKEVQGNEDITVSGDWYQGVTGSAAREVSGDSDDSVSGNYSLTVSGDKTIDTSGALTETVSGDASFECSGALAYTVTGDATYDFSGSLTQSIVSDYTLDVTGNITISSKGDIAIMDVVGAGMKISSGKVEIGGPATGIFASVLEIEAQLEALIDAITQATYPTPTGPSGPAMNAPAFASVKVQLATIKGKLDSVAGSL